MIEIPNYKNLTISHIVCDYNGTIAKDGQVLPGIKRLFEQLATTYTLHVITADTFGSVKAQLEGYGAVIKVLESLDHTKEKAAYITSLSAEQTVALGNGNNDAMMLETAVVGIAVIGDEGCSAGAMRSADVVVNSGTDALELLASPKRLIATLRR
jgi:soluble P-type ATPase